MNVEHHVVFVYGTLKRGEPNHCVIEKSEKGTARYIGKAQTTKKWPLVIASRFNIPFLLFHENEGEYVIGEVYIVNNEMLSELDQLECHPQYYERLPEEVKFIHLEAKFSEEMSHLCKPWIYFLKNYRPELLKLPFLNEYSSKGSHGLEYVERYKRKPGETYYADVMNL